jgi:uncharacterized protein YtpQ (UPF0354 family)
MSNTTSNTPQTNLSARAFCLKAIAYLKINEAPESINSAKSIDLDENNSPVLKHLGHGLLSAYLVDIGGHFQYVQRKHLSAAQLSEEELHKQAIYNLYQIATEKVKIQPYANIFAVLMGGNFESSLLMLDSFWADSCAHLAPNAYVVAFPARDILAFTDAKNENGIQELRDLCQRTENNNADHRLTNTLFTYADGGWQPYAGT